MDPRNTQALSVEQAERYAQVIELRRAGATFDFIAKTVGYAGRQGAKEAFDSAINRMGRDPAEEMRILENERLDDLWRRGYVKMAKKDKEDDEQFLDHALYLLRLSQRRAGLNGLDAPRQLEVSASIDGIVETDVGELLRERIRMVKAGLPIESDDDIPDGFIGE